MTFIFTLLLSLFSQTAEIPTNTDSEKDINTTQTRGVGNGSTLNSSQIPGVGLN